MHFTLFSDIITAVNTLGIKGRKLIKMKKVLFLILALTICLTLVACGKSEAVTAAEELIAAIGEVTHQSGEAIQKAEDAVAALSDKEKEYYEAFVERFREIGKQKVYCPNSINELTEILNRK